MKSQDGSGPWQRRRREVKRRTFDLSNFKVQKNRRGKSTTQAPCHKIIIAHVFWICDDGLIFPRVLEKLVILFLSLRIIILNNGFTGVYSQGNARIIA